MLRGRILKKSGSFLNSSRKRRQKYYSGGLAEKRVPIWEYTGTPAEIVN